MQNNFTLVTGATGGLGREFCLELVKNNQNIFITGTSAERLQHLKQELNQINSNVKIEICACDLSNSESRAKMFKYIAENNFNFSMLINNAGFITEGSIDDCSNETLLKCVRVNCEGVVDLTKFILDRKAENQDLKIITISSMAGDYPMPYMAIYASTKSFLTSFMSALRVEYAKKNVKVLIVKPGAIPTSNEMKEAIKAQGYKGKLSSVAPTIIAKKSLEKVDKKKTYVPGFFNKLTLFFSKFVTKNYQSKFVAKIWKKSQEKRNIK